MSSFKGSIYIEKAYLGHSKVSLIREVSLFQGCPRGSTVHVHVVYLHHLHVHVVYLHPLHIYTHPVLEFELRKANETIKSLRGSLTEATGK